MHYFENRLRASALHPSSSHRRKTEAVHIEASRSLGGSAQVCWHLNPFSLLLGPCASLDSSSQFTRGYREASVRRPTALIQATLGLFRRFILQLSEACSADHLPRRSGRDLIIPRAVRCTRG